VTNVPPVEKTAYNLTYSGVFKVTKDISITYNHSKNSSLPDPNGTMVNPDGSGHVPSPQGVSKDIGIKFNMGSRVSMNVLYYETTAQKTTANSNATIENLFPTIWAALDTAGVKAPDGTSALNVPNKFNRYTFNSLRRATSSR